MNDWGNPLVVGKHMQPGHIPMRAYPDASMDLTFNRMASSFVILLDGIWKFYLRLNPARVPPGLNEEVFDDPS